MSDESLDIPVEPHPAEEREVRPRRGAALSTMWFAEEPGSAEDEA